MKRPILTIIATVILTILALLVIWVISWRLAIVERGGGIPKDVPMFVLVESTIQWDVVYHKETKVMYAVSAYGTGSGVFTLLVNADGTPMLYDGAENDG